MKLQLVSGRTPSSVRVPVGTTKVLIIGWPGPSGTSCVNSLKTAGFPTRGKRPSDTPSKRQTNGLIALSTTTKVMENVIINVSEQKSKTDKLCSKLYALLAKESLFSQLSKILSIKRIEKEEFALLNFFDAANIFNRETSVIMKACHTNFSAFYTSRTKCSIRSTTGGTSS